MENSIISNMKNLVVLLDNGHGKETPGKCAPDHSIEEWSYTRELTKRIQNVLQPNDYPTVRIVVEDKDIPLGSIRTKSDCRVKRVNEIVKNNKVTNLDTVLLSIHLDAASNGDWNNARGLSAWVAPNASKRSKALASIITKNAKDMELTGNRSIPKCGYREGNFAIVRDTSCPAVLIECGFQDNKEDVEFLLSEEGKQQLVDCIVKSIREYDSQE